MSAAVYLYTNSGHGVFPPPFVGATSVLPSVFPMFGQFLTKNVFLVSTWEGAKGKERWGRDQN